MPGKITEYKWFELGVPWRVLISEEGSRHVYRNDRLLRGSELGYYGGRGYVDAMLAELEEQTKKETDNG